MYATQVSKCKCQFHHIATVPVAGSVLLLASAAIAMENSVHNSDQVIPVIAEELEIRKQQVETGKGIRVHKTVTEREQLIDEPLLVENASVSRVPIHRIVESAPPIRYAGDTTIIPVVEEQLFLEKRLVLKEEIHIRKTQTTVRDPQRVTLREEHARIENFGQAEEPIPEPALEQPRNAAGGSVLDRVFPPRTKRT